MKKLVSLLLSFFCLLNIFGANTPVSFKFGYQWNLPSLTRIGFSSDYKNAENNITALMGSKYAKDWNSVQLSNEKIGSSEHSALTLVGQEEYGNRNAVLSSDLYLWFAVRDLNAVSVAIEGHPFMYEEKMSKESTNPDPNAGKHYLSYSLVFSPYYLDGSKLDDHFNGQVTLDHGGDHQIVKQNLYTKDNGSIFGNGIFKINLKSNVSSLNSTSEVKGHFVINVTTGA